MEYTGIGKEKEEFVPRKNYEEFFRDGEVIKEMFEWTDGLMCKELADSCHKYALCVFNHAYCICWMIYSQNVSIGQIDDTIKYENAVVKKHSWAVARALATLSGWYNTLDYKVFTDFNNMLPKDYYKKQYSIDVNGRTLSQPIDFRSSSGPVDFVKAKYQVMVLMDEAIKVQQENVTLRKQLEEEKALREKAERTLEDLQKELDAWESDAFYKAVNINTVLKYVQDSGNCSSEDVKTIKLMLLALCNNQVPDEVIRKINALKCGGNFTIGVQHNHGCQQFNGNITDSDFHS